MFCCPLPVLLQSISHVTVTPKRSLTAQSTGMPLFVTTMVRLLVYLHAEGQCSARCFFITKTEPCFELVPLDVQVEVQEGFRR